MRLTRAGSVVLAILTAIPFVDAAPQAPDPFDLVIADGRVIDPESGLDAVRHVGIRNGRIAAISSTTLNGKAVLDAQGLVVAPGFIDLHAHGQQLPAARMQAFDGVTTALELEAGVLPVGAAYDAVAREGRPINYGFSVSWLFGRVAVKEGIEPQPDYSFFQKVQSYRNWQHTIATPEETDRIVALVEQGLREGGLGIGILLGYAPDSGRKEQFAVARLAKKYDVPTFTHARHVSVIEPQSSFEGLEELVALAASTGTRMHVCHLNSISARDIGAIAELIRGAQGRSVRITTEAYPYAAGSTTVGAEIFRGNWRERMGGATASDLELNGRPLDDTSLAAAQEKTPGAIIVIHFMRPERNPADQALLDQAVLMPSGAIASDGMPWVAQGKTLTGNVWPLPAEATAHPRSAGTFTRFLRDYVRERKTVDLREGLRRMSLIPAQILEQSVPQMKKKGRLQVGADADLVVFDPATVTDRATFTAPNATAEGMRYVVVNGTPVIRDGALVRDALPGRPIRRPVAPREP